MVVVSWGLSDGGDLRNVHHDRLRTTGERSAACVGAVVQNRPRIILCRCEKN